MQATLKLKTRVLPGHRVEFASPELPEGAEVEIFVALPEETPAVPAEQEQTQGVWDYIQSLPAVQRTPEEWAQIEREFQEERNSWDR
jgi:hypothetical protein